MFYAEHWKVGTIASNYAIHPETVQNALDRPCPAEKGVSTPSVLDPYLLFIMETLEHHPRLRATRIYDMIRERGYKGSLRTVRKRVRFLRPSRAKEVFLRVETLPGEQAQIDWAKVGELKVPGGVRALWVFVMVLAHSRAMWGELVLDLDAQSLRRSLLRAAQFFGGCTRQWLFDNPKTVVIERDGSAVRYHPELLSLASELCVQPSVCRVRKPVDKGKVERSIRYLRDRFFAARTIYSIKEGNKQLKEFIDQIAMSRPHPRWPDRTVRDVWEEEREHLLSLPTVLPSEQTVCPVVADRTAFVRFDTNRYSVPPGYASRSLCLAATDIEIRLLDGSTVVAEHKRCLGRHQVIEQREHREELLAQKRAARASKGRDVLAAQVPGIEHLIERWVDAGRVVNFMVGRTMKLLDSYGADILREAVAQMNINKTHDIGALSLLCEQQRRARNRPIPRPVTLGSHVVDRDVVQNDLGGYDHV
jgi:transposase